MKKNNLFTLLIGIIFFAGLFIFYSKTYAPTNQIVGNDKDENGCIASAGYTFSLVRAECVRIFEVGVSMDPKASELDKGIGAFVVFAKENKESSPAEIYIAIEEGPLTLAPVSNGVWKNEKYTLRLNKEVITLDNSAGKLLFQGKVVNQ